MTPRRTLVTGGVRSGKSVHAESLLREQLQVTYIAPGPIPDPTVDPDWAQRVAQHQHRRPAHWTTVETVDVANAVRSATGGVLLDCLGTWVTSLMDQLHGWDRPEGGWRPEFDDRLESLAGAWSGAPGPVVAVTNEVGMGVVPAHRSGRLFRDLLGSVNQRIAAVSDDVLLVIAGRVLRL
jgi:adenosylcobinamide kinase / adenosylcobinamide-phosphate guanylyltransferase